MGDAKRKMAVIGEKEKWPVECAFSVADRLWLFNLLPKQGDITSLRTIRELREAISFSDAEKKQFKIENSIGGIKWDDKLEKPKTIAIGRTAWEVIANTLRDLDKQKKLPIDCIALYEKFCG